MTVSNILRREASLDEEGGGLTAVVGSTNSSIEGSLDGGGQDASPVEDSTLRRLKLALISA